MTIHQAVCNGDAMVVECIVDTRRDVLEHKNTLGRTPLLQAAANGSLDIVRLLVLKGANVAARSYKTDNESMAVHLAAEGGHVEVVKFFVELVPDQLEIRDKDGDTPLARAAYNGKDTVVMFLLTKGANIEAPGYRGRTPLLRASANGHISTLKLLLSQGASIIAKSNWADFEKNSVSLAAVFGHVKTVEYLLDLEPKLACETNIHGDSLICYAALGGHVPVIQFFLERFSANIETIGRSGRTPLLQSASMGHIEAVKYLIEKGANIFARSHSDDDEQTVLHLSARFGHANVCKYLLGIEPKLSTLVDKQGRTAFDAAKAREKSSVIELFSEHFGTQKC